MFTHILFCTPRILKKTISKRNKKEQATIRYKKILLFDVARLDLLDQILALDLDLALLAHLAIKIYDENIIFILTPIFIILGGAIIQKSSPRQKF